MASLKNLFIWVSLIILATWANAHEHHKHEAKTLSANIINNKGENIGVANFEEVNDGTLMTVELSLDNGSYAMHIHQNGVCNTPDFKLAGGHFNPENKDHGFHSHGGKHVGDLPNIHILDNRIKQEIFIPNYSLDEEGILNRAIVLHAGADDYKTNPAGAAGKRIACAVIE